MSFKCKICCCPMKSSNSSFKWTENKFATTDWLLHEMDAEEIQQRALTLAILYTTLMLFISGLLVMSFTQYRRRKRLARRSKGEQNHEAEEENVGRQQPTNPWTGAAKERGHIVLFEFADSARIMYFTRRPTNYLSPQPLTLNRTKWISWSPRTSCVTRENRIWKTITFDVRLISPASLPHNTRPSRAPRRSLKANEWLPVSNSKAMKTWVIQLSGRLSACSLSRIQTLDHFISGRTPI